MGELMEKRVVIAIVLSIAVMYGYSYLVPQPPQKTAQGQAQTQTATAAPSSAAAVPPVQAASAPVSAVPERDVLVDTDLYRAVFSTRGGSLKSQIPNGVMTCQKHLLNHTLNTFSPRVGFAWDPTKAGKMSVRGGFGIFFDKPSEQLYNDYFTNSPKLLVLTFSSVNMVS
jgi:hypothetical protein